MNANPGNRRYAVGWRAVSAQKYDSTTYLRSENDREGVSLPSFVFTRRQANAIAFALVSDPRVGKIVVRYKESKDHAAE